MTTVPPLPDGFKLDGPPAAVPPLPSGFVLDADTANPAAAPSGWNAESELLNSAMFGALDEIGAAVFTPIELGIQAYRGDDLSIGGAYDTALARFREGQDAYRTENPIGSTVAGVAGGLLTGAAVAPKVFASGASLGMNALRGAGAGAVGGAVAGFGEGRGMEDRIEDMIMGGAIGMGVGAAAPAAGAAAGAGIRRLASARAARETLASTGIGRRAAEQVELEMGRDGLDAQAARDRAASMGPDAMLLDTGDNLAGGAGAVANLPGAAAQTLRGRLGERTRAAPTRITTAADTAMGPARNIAETVDQLIADRAATSGPAYDRALNRPIEWNQRLQAFIDDPVIRRGLREGVEIQRLEALARGTEFNPLTFAINGVDEAGDPIVAGVPNMRTLQTAKRGLDNVIESYRDPISGRLNLDERGRAINEVQRAFLTELDTINPDYANARRLYAGPTRVRDALRLGQDVFERSVRPDQLRQRLAAMTDDEREAFQIGARDQLAEVMGTARRDATAARGMFETGWNREKLGLVLGDKERAGEFLETLGTETRFANRANAITGNSATADRTQRATEYTGQRSAVRAALDPSSGLWGDVKRAGARGVDAILDGRSARSAELMRGEFADAVSRQGPERDELLDAIMGYGQARTRAAEQALPYEELLRAIMTGGAVAIGGRAGTN